MATRLSLQTLLETLLGSRNVYFDPPATKKLSYPCIIYTFGKEDKKRADNILYNHTQAYDIIYVDNNPDSTFPDVLRGLPYCAFDRHYTADNLHHFVFTIYF